MAALVGAAIFYYLENQRMEADIFQLQKDIERMAADDARLLEQVRSVESQLNEERALRASMGTVCDRSFPAGLYRLETNTDYGTSTGDYEIYHVSIRLSEWSINLGTRLSAFGIPADFYLDYDGDGRIDTALAARFVREIPVAGNALADRLLADSRVHQNLYAVFSCEWRNAEFTSSEDMNARVSGASNMLWDLVQDNSEGIVDWIRGISP